MKNSKKTLLAKEFTKILEKSGGVEEGMRELAEFISENFIRKKGGLARINLTEGTQKYKILSYMVKNPEEWVYAKTFQNKKFFSKAPFIGYEAGTRIGEISNCGYLDKITEPGSFKRRGFVKYRIKPAFLKMVKIALENQGTLKNLK